MKETSDTQVSFKRAFWIEVGLALLSLTLFALTLAWPEWIEGLFGVEPDAGSGAAEWAVAALLALSSFVWGLRVRAQWRAAAART